MPIQVSDRADLARVLLAEQDPGNWQQEAQKFTNYVGINHFHQNSQNKKQRGGREVERRIQLRLNQDARNGSLYSLKAAGKRDTRELITSPFHHFENDYGTIDERELAMFTSREALVDEVLTMRNDGMIAMFDLIEPSTWQAPTGPSDTKLRGIPYWVVPSDTAEFGFNGLNPSGFSDTGGLDRTSTDNANWRNGTFTFTEVGDEMFNRIRTAIKKCGWKAVISNPSHMSGSPTQEPDQQFYMNEALHSSIEQSVEKQNDNLGMDRLSTMNKSLINRSPLNYVPALDDESDTLFYGLDRRTIETVCLQGVDMKRRAPTKMDNYMAVISGEILHSTAMICVSARRNFVGKQSA
jgi:hypothetical protein